jgi:hypothetical protein
MHVYRLVSLNAHISLNHHLSLNQTVFEKVLRDYFVVHLNIQKGDLVQLLIQLSFYVDIIEILNLFSRSNRIDWADRIF